jgi:FAD/FMN-containing dehydrogenase
VTDGTGTVADGTAPSAGALRAFRDGFAGEIVLPPDPGYDAARSVWNGMVDRYPALVVRPSGVGDVVAAIGFAREHALVIAVRCGGHSIPGLSTCDGGIVVDLARMRGVEVDPEARTARVAGGTLLAELDREAQTFGLVCPVGVVGHTGVAGLTLGGGMGRLQRRYGLTIDNLLAVDLVTAEGAVVRASEDENADLFWGLRGAGANFGIATSFEFRLHPLDPVITHGTLVHPVERAVELAALVRETLARASDELWLSYGFGLDARRRPLATVSVFHSGPLERAERDTAAVRAFGPPSADSVAPKPYVAVQTMSDEAMGWGHRYSMKSAFVRDLPDDLVRAAVEHLVRIPNGADGGFSLWSCGGAIAALPDDATAFTGRRASFWIAAETVWEDVALDETCRAWCRAAAALVAPYATEGRYVNDVEETGDVLQSVYGAAKLERLRAIKRAWDPDNVFRLNQNVRP